MNALFIERWWPYASSMAVLIAWWLFLGKGFPVDATNLLLATGTSAAVLVGFVATVMAITLSITGSPVFRALRASGYHRDLFRYLFEAALLGAALLVLALLGFFVPDLTQVPEAYKAGWVLLASSTLFVFARVFGLVFKLLRQA